MVAMESVKPTKPKIFYFIWTFTEKVCQAHLRSLRMMPIPLSTPLLPKMYAGFDLLSWLGRGTVSAASSSLPSYPHR